MKNCASGLRAIPHIRRNDFNIKLLGYINPQNNKRFSPSDEPPRGHRGNTEDGVVVAALVNMLNISFNSINDEVIGAALFSPVGDVASASEGIPPGALGG